MTARAYGPCQGPDVASKRWPLIIPDEGPASIYDGEHVDMALSFVYGGAKHRAILPDQWKDYSGYRAVLFAGFKSSEGEARWY